MKKFLLTLAALPIAAFAGEASGQNVANAGAAGVQNQIANLEARFNAGLNAGVFTSGERDQIDRQLAALRSLERNYSANGLSVTERTTLQQRIRTLRDQLRAAGGPSWANQYGWRDVDLDSRAGAPGTEVAYDAYGRPMRGRSVSYDRYGRPITNDRDRYDPYGRQVASDGGGYDQYGRPVADDGTYGQGGPYEPVSQRGSGVGNVLGGVLGSVVGGGRGVGGVLGNVVGGGRGVGGVVGSVVGGRGGVGSILGSVLGRGGMRTGDVVTGAIGSVLGGVVGSGSRFRDTNEVYFRSDGQSVYEIDARTNTVMRVHPVQR